MWLSVLVLVGVGGLSWWVWKDPLLYYAKHAYFLIMCSCVSLYMLPVFLMRPRDVRNTGLGFPILCLALKPLGIEWEILGKERLTGQNSACIIVSNHQSALDFIVPLELSPGVHPALVAKRSLLYVFPFGFAAWLCGGIFIDRARSQQSQATISTTAKDLHRNKIKMWMFPEGTRRKNSQLLPFKKGAFQVAVLNNLPIVPLVISPYSFIDDTKKVFGSGKMVVSVLPPIPTSSEDDVTLLTETCRTAMNREFQRLSASLIQHE